MSRSPPSISASSNLTRYQTPDPRNYFYGQKLLSAEVRDLYGLLIDGMQGTRGAIRTRRRWRRARSGRGKTDAGAARALFRAGEDRAGRQGAGLLRHARLQRHGAAHGRRLGEQGGGFGLRRRDRPRSRRGAGHAAAFSSPERPVAASICASTMSRARPATTASTSRPQGGVGAASLAPHDKTGGQGLDQRRHSAARGRNRRAARCRCRWRDRVSPPCKPCRFRCSRERLPWCGATSGRSAPAKA